MFYGLYFYDYISYGLLIIGALITIIADIYLNFSYGKYRKIKNQNNLTGFEIARQILDANGLEDVHVIEVKGKLSDHYDPTRKVVKLSKEIFNGSSIASSSVAAHEVGHAIQDKDNYKFMRLRGKMVPFVNFGTRIGYIVVFIGIIFGNQELAIGGIALLLLLLLFQLVTLPVEFDASRRAKEELSKLNLLSDSEVTQSGKMLRAAAFTYVAALANTILELLRLLYIIFGRDD